MSDYATPGVYVKEIQTGTRPIRAVGTSTAGFIGLTPLASAVPEQARYITNWTQFREQYFPAEHPDGAWTPLAHAVYGFFLNGGSACYVLNTGKQDASLAKGLDQLNRIDEIAILAAPGRTSLEDYDAIRNACEQLEDRVGILDGPEQINEYSLTVLRGQAWTGKKPDSAWEMPQGSKRGFVTLYAPWLMVANPDPATDKKIRAVRVPPSGHVAGIWARSDASRGVHKAPANEGVRGALDLAYQFSHEEQKGLNTRGVNCIRYFTGEGNLVWGARTLLSDPLWTYLNVRRLFNQIEESIAEGTRWIVFEPNDRPLWQAIIRDVTAFLMGFWRSGALMGRTPEEAFFVKCDEENNPFDRIVKGEVHIDIGIAPVRPAEFVIFQIAQYEAGSEVKISGG